MGTAARVLPMPIIRNRKPRRIPLLSRALAVPYGRPRRSGHRVWGPRVRGITAIFKTMCAATGIKDLQFPNLRREAPSQLFEKGLGIMDLKEITGRTGFMHPLRYTPLRAEGLVPRPN